MIHSVSFSRKFIFKLMFLVMLTSSFQGVAQGSSVYPFEVSASIFPPYSSCLDSYNSNGKFLLTIRRKDLYHNSSDFSARIIVTDFSGNEKLFYQTILSDAPIFTINSFENFLGNSDPCFADGVYTFSFDVVDRSLGYDVALSLPYTLQLYMERGKAPILNLPFDEHNFSPCNGSEGDYDLSFSPVFSWNHYGTLAANSSYLLEIVEVQEGISPEVAFNSSNNKIEKKTNSQSLNISYPNFFKIGSTYAWRVSVIDLSNSSMSNYANNGVSEVYTFSICKPEEPEEPEEEEPVLTSKSVDDDWDQLKLHGFVSSPDGYNLHWINNTQHREEYSGVSIEVQKLGKDRWSPYSKLFAEGDNLIQLDDINELTDALLVNELEPGIIYVARGQYFKEDSNGERIYAPYSDTIHFSFDEPSEDVDCGSDLPNLSDCEGRELQSIEKGDIITCYGTPVEITEINEVGDGRYSGKGKISFKFAKLLCLIVEFENILLNCNKELVDGTIKTIRDLDNNLEIDLNNLTGTQATGENGTEVADVASPQEYSQEKFDAAPIGTIFLKEDGNIVIKNSDGKEVEIGKQIDNINTGESPNSEILETNLHYIQFTESTAPFDDGYHLIRDCMSGHYKFFDNANNYRIPYLGLTFGRTEVAVAVEKSNSGDKFTDVKFVIPFEGGKFLELKYEEIDDNFSVTIPGIVGDNIHSTEVLVLGQMEGESEYKNCGKMIVSNFPIKEPKKVLLVPVAQNGIGTNADGVEDYLNNLYGGLGFSFEVELVDPILVDESYLSEEEGALRDLLDDGLSIGADDQSVWTNYTDEMKKLTNYYISKNPDIAETNPAIIFLVEKPQEDQYSGVQGDMPRGKSVGFVFTNNVTASGKDFNRLVAHELGHGLFKLEHIFNYGHGDCLNQGATTNLMDYSSKTPNDELVHFQWHNMHKDFLMVWSFTESDEEGMAKNPFLFALKGGLSVLFDISKSAAVDCALEPHKFESIVNEKFSASNVFYTTVDFLKDEVKDETKTVFKIFNINKYSLDIVKYVTKIGEAFYECNKSTDENCLCNKIGKDVVGDIFSNKLKDWPKVKGYLKRTDKTEQQKKDFVKACLDNILSYPPSTGKIKEIMETIKTTLKDKINKTTDNEVTFDKLMEKVLESLVSKCCELFSNIIGEVKDLVNNWLDSPVPEKVIQKQTNTNKSLPKCSINDYVHVQHTFRENNIVFSIERGYDYRINTWNNISIDTIRIIHNDNIKYTFDKTAIEHCKRRNSINGETMNSETLYLSTGQSGYASYDIVIPCESEEAKKGVYTLELEYTFNCDKGSTHLVPYNVIFGKNGNLTLRELNEALNPPTNNYSMKSDECSQSSLFDATATASSRAEAEKLALNNANNKRIKAEEQFNIPKCSEWVVNNNDATKKTYYITSPTKCGGSIEKLFTVTLSKAGDPGSGKCVMNQDVARKNIGKVFVFHDGEYILVNDKTNKVIRMPVADYYKDMLTEINTYSKRIFVASMLTWLRSFNTGSNSMGNAVSDDKTQHYEQALTNMINRWDSFQGWNSYNNFQSYFNSGVNFLASLENIPFDLNNLEYDPCAGKKGLLCAFINKFAQQLAGIKIGVDRYDPSENQTNPTYHPNNNQATFFSLGSYQEVTAKEELSNALSVVLVKTSPKNFTGVNYLLREPPTNPNKYGIGYSFPTFIINYNCNNNK